MARLVFAEENTKVRKPRVIKTGGWRNVRLLLEPTTRQWWEDPDVVVAFNLPRISAALERLMGTNVVRLTDRNYMKELRERIDDDYRNQLQKRIRIRELKELERERILIIEGYTDIIPPELENDPTFVVHKKANIEIQKTRAKLKTNREKNSERLKLQGVKWERERLLHEEEERARELEARERYKQQKAIEQKFIEEDETAGMNLIRIFDEDWRPCETDLKIFLEEERAKMKDRSLRKPTPFSSDPKDILNVIRAKKQKALEEKLKKERGESMEMEGDFKSMASGKKKFSKQKSSNMLLKSIGTGSGDMPFPILHLEMDELDEGDNEKLNMVSDDVSDMTSGESFDESSTISMAKQRYALMLQQELENEVSAGLLISKEQYDHLRYEDERIMQLRNARDMRELYELAENIIHGDLVEEEGEEEENVEEEGAGPDNISP